MVPPLLHLQKHHLHVVILGGGTSKQELEDPEVWVQGLALPLTGSVIWASRPTPLSLSFLTCKLGSLQCLPT